jgi:spore germination protein GerM
MTRPRPIFVAGALLAAAAVGWLIVAGVRRVAPSATPGVTTGATPQQTGPERRISVTLFFVSEDGLALVGAQREVSFGEPVAEQARHIVEAQLGAAPGRLASAIPEGTRLNALFVSERGHAFVDLSRDATAKHTGGALDELFTVYAVINSLTVNLPAITQVQILIDGKEIDTLAGHVDLRHPLPKSMKWVRTEKDAS